MAIFVFLNFTSKIYVLGCQGIQLCIISLAGKACIVLICFCMLVRFFRWSTSSQAFLSVSVSTVLLLLLYTFSGVDVAVATPLYTKFVFMQFIPFNEQFSLFLQLHTYGICFVFGDCCYFFVVFIYNLFHVFGGAIAYF